MKDFDKTDIFGSFPGGRFIGPEEKKEILSILDARSPYRFYGIAAQKTASRLEELCVETFQRNFALGLSSGTAALHTALFALGVRPGDEVVFPSYAWSADLMAVLALGAVPVMAALDETWGLDPQKLEACLSSRTKAVMAVHMRGGLCRIPKIQEMCSRHKVFLIEDGSQCLGGTFSGKKVGTFGDVSVFSFQYHKLITSGEGGLLLADDNAVYERACRFHDLGMRRRVGEADPVGPDAIESFGLNYRMSEIQAAMLIAQTQKVPRILKGLKQSYEKGMERLHPIMKKFGLRVRPEPEGAQRNHAFLCLTGETTEAAEKAHAYLQEKGIPIQKADRLDPHHFRTWEAFLKREGRPYRTVDPETSLEILSRALFIEVNSKNG